MGSPDSSHRKQPRRDALIRATIEIVAERGVAGVTHRAVTERAGVPLTSATYYFATIDGLVSESLRWYANDRADIFRAAVAEALEDSKTVRSVTEAVAHMIEALPRWERVAFYELLCNAARFPAGAEFARESIEGYSRLVAHVFRQSGQPATTELVRGVFTLEIGRGLLGLIDPQFSDLDWAGTNFRALVAGYHLLAEDPERVEELMRRELK